MLVRLFHFHFKVSPWRTPSRVCENYCWTVHQLLLAITHLLCWWWKQSGKSELQCFACWSLATIYWNRTLNICLIIQHKRWTWLLLVTSFCNTWNVHIVTVLKPIQREKPLFASVPPNPHWISIYSKYFSLIDFISICENPVVLENVPFSHLIYMQIHMQIYWKYMHDDESHQISENPKNTCLKTSPERLKLVMAEMNVRGIATCRFCLWRLFTFSSCYFGTYYNVEALSCGTRAFLRTMIWPIGVF